MTPSRRKSDEVTPDRQEITLRRSANIPRELLAVHPTQLEFLGMPAVIGSRAMQRVIEKVQKVAKTESTVLIAGESGVGKEMVARAVHHYSPRMEKPFVDVNCAAFPENLIESELFGYEKGAFSGADNVKQGLFETAAGGTLFLDEIGELEARMQSKLLRVLDGQPYFRLGGTRKVQTGARVIAATNSNLQEAVNKGWFRADLYHRLDAIQLVVPPLRERVDDIKPLCDLFLKSSACTLREDALELLRSYSWPGNIRELRNALNKAVVFAEESVLTPDDFPPEMRGQQPPPSQQGYSLEKLEEQTIFRALEQTGGHQQKAAEILGISRRTLIRKLKQYGPLRGHGHTESGAGRHGGHGPGGRKAGPGVTL